MFWGLIVQPNMLYLSGKTNSFHISQAALDVNSTTENADVQLFLKNDNVDFILCTLNKHRTVQAPLDITISSDDKVSFHSVGGIVHLTGYLVVEESFTDSEEEDASLVAPKPNGKQQVTQESSSENEDSEHEVGGEENADDSMQVNEVEIVQPSLNKIVMSIGVPKNGVKSKDSKHKKLQQKLEGKEVERLPPGVRKIAGGVLLQDLREGRGAAANTGTKVQIYYEGRLESNNTLFDKTNTGKGFEFVIGEDDVITAWHVGIVGMKVGGKRKITCPPGMAYGAKGCPPAVPPNATLIFVVELIQLH